MKRVVIGIACLFALAVNCLGQRPTIYSNPFAPMVIESQDICGFDILATPQADKPNKGKIIYFANTGLMSGPLFVTLKNLNNNKTLDLNISGPVLFDFSGNGAMLGPGLPVETLPADIAAAAGVPRLPLFRGRASFQADDLGNLVAITFTGRVDNVCDLMQ